MLRAALNVDDHYFAEMVARILGQPQLKQENAN